MYEMKIPELLNIYMFDATQNVRLFYNRINIIKIIKTKSVLNQLHAIPYLSYPSFVGM